jgi:hypothetical protein
MSGGMAAKNFDRLRKAAEDLEALASALRDSASARVAAIEADIAGLGQALDGALGDSGRFGAWIADRLRRDASRLAAAKKERERLAQAARERAIGAKGAARLAARATRERDEAEARKNLLDLVDSAVVARASSPGQDGCGNL